MGMHWIYRLHMPFVASFLLFAVVFALVHAVRERR
jgi:hypothetical protein